MEIINCKEKSLFKDILDIIPYRIWVMDMNDMIIWENRMSRGEGRNSCESPSLLTAAWKAQIIATGMLSKVMDKLSHAKHGESGVLEFKRRNPQGVDSWIRVHYNPIYDESGIQVGIYGMEKDITFQKEALPKLVKLQSSNKIERGLT